MPRPQREVEKVNDLKGTLIRLFKNLNKWKYLLVIAVIFAIVAAILSTVAPNKLADVTDVITEGIKPRTENIEKLNKEIYKHANITKINNIENYKELTQEEKLEIFNTFKYKKIEITREDQVKYFDILLTMDKETINEKALVKLDKIPNSI